MLPRGSASDPLHLPKRWTVPKRFRIHLTACTLNTVATDEDTAPSPSAVSEAPADSQQACPYLGLENDSGTRSRQSTDTHRCYRDPGIPLQISEGHQRTYCLTEANTTCPGFASGWTDVTGPARSRVQSSARKRGATRFIRRFRIRRKPSMVFTIVFGIGALGFALISTSLCGSPDPTPLTLAPMPTPTSVPTEVTPEATPTPPAPTVPTPTNTPVAPSPTPTSTPVSTPTSSPETMEYTVQPGDSYSALALEFEMTLEEFLAMIGRTLEDPLFVGDTLIIKISSQP